MSRECFPCTAVYALAAHALHGAYRHELSAHGGFIDLWQLALSCNDRCRDPKSDELVPVSGTRQLLQDKRQLTLHFEVRMRKGGSGCSVLHTAHAPVHRS